MNLENPTISDKNIDTKKNPEKIEQNEIKKQTKEELDFLKSEMTLNQISDIYEELQKGENSSLEEKVKILEELYYNLTGFPIPFNKNGELFSPID